MRIGLTLGGLVCLVAALTLVPWTGIGAGSPGSVCYDINSQDPNWLGTWSGVMTQNDNDETTWTTGLTLYEVYYTTGAGDENGFTRYISEMAIPWIGIQPVNGNYIQYEFSESTSDEMLYLDPDDESGAWSYHDWTVNEPYYSVQAQYDLDVDGNGIDWRFHISLQILNIQGVDTIILEFSVDANTHPAFGSVQKLVVPIRIDPDVYDTPTNNVHCQGQGQITSETSKNAANQVMAMFEQYVEPFDPHIINIVPHPCANNIPNTETWYFLHKSASEFSQDPSTYLSSENLEDDDGLAWYVMTYLPSQQNNPPIDGAGVSGIYIESFDA